MPAQSPAAREALERDDLALALELDKHPIAVILDSRARVTPAGPDRAVSG